MEISPCISDNRTLSLDSQRVRLRHLNSFFIKIKFIEHLLYALGEQRRESSKRTARPDRGHPEATEREVREPYRNQGTRIRPLSQNFP